MFPLNPILKFFFFATLGSILYSQLSIESGKFQLARWSHEVGLFPAIPVTLEGKVGWFGGGGTKRGGGGLKNGKKHFCSKVLQKIQTKI